MQLFEVKNDIAKILYNPTENHLLPSDFLLIEDANQKLVAQIITTEMTDDLNNNMAVLRLSLAIDKEDNIFLYNGYIPSKASKIIYIHSDEIMELIKGSGLNIYFGNLSNHPSCYVKPSISFINDNLYIQSDRQDQTEIIINNIISELQNKNQRVLLLDFNGKYNNLENVVRIKVCKDFKLPLNVDALNTILEYETSECSLEDKTLIQSIILEVKDYIQTLPDKYLPFNLFKGVVNDEFISSPSYGLMYFRNKLWQYAQDNIFAESKEDFEVLDSLLPQSNIVVIDASSMNGMWYQLIVQTILDLIQRTYYFIFSLNDVRMDKKSITGMYNKPNIIPIVSTGFESYYSPILKSVCRNQILCKPSNYYEEKDTYSILLNRINADEMILYGESTLYLPLPVELKQFTPSTHEDLIEYEIKKDVDKLLSSPQTVIPTEAVVQHLAPSTAISNYEIADDDLTDSDLDFLDENLSSQEESNIVESEYEMFDPEMHDDTETKSVEPHNDKQEETIIPVEILNDINESSKDESETGLDLENVQSETVMDAELPLENTGDIEMIEEETLSDEITSYETDAVEPIDDTPIDNTNDEEIVPVEDVIQDITEKLENKEINAEEEKAEEVSENIQNDENFEDEDEKEEQKPPVINENINTKKNVQLPIYETDNTSDISREDIPFKVGDKVFHPKHGKGVIEGFANYSNKILFCQIEFENVGRRILDPRIAGIEKIS